LQPAQKKNPIYYPTLAVVSSRSLENCYQSSQV
jgi:hypothetical protein